MPPADDLRRARETARALVNIEDPVLRRSALFNRLRAMPAPEAAALLDGLVALAMRRDPDAAPLIPYFADLRVVTAALGQRQMAAILGAARESGRDGVTRLLTAQAPRRAAAGPEQEPERSGTDHMPLGLRTHLGRTGPRTALDRLIYDQNPRVIENLLANPRCTEREAIRIAAHRPTSAAILSVVFRHPRWASRYAVKRVLALNPHTTPAQAIGLLPSLLTQDLAVVAADETLHRDVVEAAENILRARGAVLPEPPAPLPETAAAVAQSREAVSEVAAAFLASLRIDVEEALAGVEAVAPDDPGADGAADDADVLEIDLVEVRDEAEAARAREAARRPPRGP